MGGAAAAAWPPGEVGNRLPDAGQVATWCRARLGSAPEEVLFRAGHLSAVVGLRLRDGRRVVVKLRPPLPRVAACVAVQRLLAAAGYPCPRPLAGPAPCGALLATAEELVPGGDPLPRDRDAPRRYARALQRLVSLAPDPGTLPSLDPAPPWVGWDHHEAGVWPRPDDRDGDLNRQDGPEWLDQLGRRVRARLRGAALPGVVGHADWEAQNLRWKGGVLHVAHDWDSVAVLPEAALAGAAAAVFTAQQEPRADPTPAETAAFLAAYADARRRPWSAPEREVAWAAGLWIRAFNAKKETLDDPAGGTALRSLRREVAERAARAGF